jgi:hypothetical protein
MVPESEQPRIEVGASPLLTAGPETRVLLKSTALHGRPAPSLAEVFATLRAEERARLAAEAAAGDALARVVLAELGSAAETRVSVPRGRVRHG